LHELSFDWEDYEDLLGPIGEANGAPISDNEAEFQVLTRISTSEGVKAEAKRARMAKRQKNLLPLCHSCLFCFPLRNFFAKLIAQAGIIA